MAFAEPLPLKFAWASTRSELISLFAPNRTWVIGEGRVEQDAKFPDHEKSDTWRDLASLDNRKKEAIALYKTELDVSTIEAKKAVEHFIANS